MPSLNLNSLWLGVSLALFVLAPLWGEEYLLNKFFFRTSLEGRQGYYVSMDKGRLDGPVHMDPDIDRLRREAKGAEFYYPEWYINSLEPPSTLSSSTFLNHYTGLITDTPLRHSSFSTTLNTLISFDDRYTLQVALTAEQRGSSYGVTSLSKFVFLPEITFLVNEEFRVGQAPMSLDFSYGNLNERRVGEGLRVYNIDWDGAIVRLGIGNFYYEYSQVFDLYYGVGLGIDEYLYNSLGYLLPEKNLDIALSVTGSESVLYGSYLTVGGRGSYKPFNSLRLFGEYDYRFSRGDSLAGYGFLLGTDFEYSDEKNDFTLRPRFRYYTEGYNSGHYFPEQTSYRDPYQAHPQFFNYNSSVGTQLYPLRNYWRTLSQWAFYTEYGGTIGGLELYLRYERELGKYFYVSSELDTILTFQIGEEYPLFLHYLYLLELAFRPYDGIEFSMGATNKVMNLDVHYQTFYISIVPYAVFGVTMTF